MKAKIAAYSILSGIVICGLVIFLHVAEIRTITLRELVGALLLSPFAGLLIWIRYDWYPKKIAEMSDSERRDQEKP